MRSTLLLVTTLFAGNCFGWADTGHQAVCQIAYDELGDAARAEVDRLIAEDPQFETFAESCVWADGPPRQRPPDHYMNFPRNTRAIGDSTCVMAETCLFTAIEADSRTLTTPGSTDSERLDALKLLGHWVGDIHQPFHASFGDDLGANAVEAIVQHDGELVETNLHGVWDYWIVAKRLGDDYRVLASDLRQNITDVERELWGFDSPVEWADESFQLAVAVDTRYCFQRQGSCWYGENNRILNPGEPRRVLTIGDDYMATHLANVELRLAQAGIRLGALLNSLLDR